MEKKIRNKSYLGRLGDNAHKLSVRLSVEKISFISDDIILCLIMIMIIMFLFSFLRNKTT